MIQIKVKRIAVAAKLPLRAYATDSGFDVYSLEKIELPPFMPVTLPLGIAVGLPPGYELQLRPRSSLSRRGILCHFGTIDEEYTAEVSVVLHNLCRNRRNVYPYTVQQGDRIAQMVPARVISAEVIEVDTLPPTKRGGNGWGSTGR